MDWPVEFQDAPSTVHRHVNAETPAR
jgi:hypothetical protein